MAVPNIADPSAVANSTHPRTQIDLAGLTVLANGTITREWFSYGTTTGYGSTIDATPVVQGNLAGWSAVTVTGLDPGTTYHFKARATNASGQGNGNDTTCDTHIGAASCSTDSYAPDYTAVSINATVTGAGGPNGAITDKAINLYADAACTTLVQGSGSLGAGSSGFTFNFTGLADGTVYYARATVTNNNGDSDQTQVGNVLAVGTIAFAAPTLGNTSTPWAKTTTTISPKATYTAENGHAVTACGFVLSEYGTNAAPTIGGTGVTQKAGSPPGVSVEFSDTFTGLTAGRIYAVRAYATNATGTTYTAVIQIVTSVLTGFAETAVIPTATLKGHNTIPVTGKAETAVIPTPVVSSAHLGGKAETAVIPTPTMKSPLTRTVAAFAEVAAVGRVFMYRPLAASATIVQTITGTPFTTSSQGNTLTLTAGNLVVVFVMAAAGGTSHTCTDNNGNTYVKEVVDTAQGLAAIWRAYNVNGGSTTITVGSMSGGLPNEVMIREYSGVVSASDPFDKSAHTNGNGTSITTGNTATLTQADELVVVCGHVNAIGSITAGTGFGHANSTNSSSGSNQTFGIADEIVHATTAVNGALTCPSGFWSSALATFKLKAVSQPQGIVFGGFAETASIPTATVKSKNTIAVTAVTQAHTIPTPTVRTYAQLTGKAETAVIPTPTLRSVNHLALTGKAETAVIPTPTMTSRYLGLVDGFGEVAEIGTVVVFNRHTYATVAAFTETAVVPTPSVSSANHLALTGLPEAASIPTPSVTGANRLLLTAFPETALIPTPTLHNRNTVPLAAVTCTAAIPTPTLSSANVLHLTGLTCTALVGTASTSSANHLALTGVPELASIPAPLLRSASTVPLVGYPQSQTVTTPTVRNANRISLTGVTCAPTPGVVALHGANLLVLVGYPQPQHIGTTHVLVPAAFPTSGTVTQLLDLHATVTLTRDLHVNLRQAPNLRGVVTQQTDLHAPLQEVADLHTDLVLTSDFGTSVGTP